MIFSETERLRLRSLEKTDLPRLVELIGDWAVAQWLSRVPHPYTIKDAEDWLARTSALESAGKPEYFVLCEKNANILMGACSIHPPQKPDPKPGEAELGYWLGKPFWGQGYMSEAVKAVLPIAFASPDVLLITSRTNPKNQASRNVLRKASFKYLGIFPRTEDDLRGEPECTRWELAKSDYRI